MGNHKSVDLILISSHGQIIEYLDVPAGTTLNLPEYVGIKAYSYAIKKYIKRIVNTPRIALGLLGLMINLFGQYYFMRYMRKRSEWSEIVVHGSGTLNLLLYLILFYVSDFGKIWVTIILPLGVAQSVNLGVLLLHLGYEALTKRLEKPQKDTTPLQKVMIFAHGEWALKNINSLILYFQNYESASKSKLSERIVERVETFLNLTLPAIKELLFETSDDHEAHSSMGDIKSELELLSSDLIAFHSSQSSWNAIRSLLSSSNSIP